MIRYALLLVLFPFAAQSQETLLDDATVIGGFGGPMVELSQMNTESVVGVGGGGAVLVNRFFLGGFGMGMAAGNEVIIENIPYELSMGMGGAWLGWNSDPDEMVHISASVRVGWGGVNLKAQNNTGLEENLENQSDAIFSITPELGAELNVTHFFRVAAFAGYRSVQGVELAGFTDADFSSPTFMLALKFGGFGKFGE